MITSQKQYDQWLKTFVRSDIDKYLDDCTEGDFDGWMETFGECGWDPITCETPECSPEVDTFDINDKVITIAQEYFSQR